MPRHNVCKPKPRPHLKLVPKPRSRRRRFKVGRVRRRPKYEHAEALHAYEEQIVTNCLRQLGRPVTVLDFEAAWPGRFNRRELWMTLVRLATRGWPKDVQTSGRFHWAFWAKVKVNTMTEFWL
jgi:hypothetical protein